MAGLSDFFGVNATNSLGHSFMFPGQSVTATTFDLNEAQRIVATKAAMQNAMQQQINSPLFNPFMQMSTPGMSHIGAVREFRRTFKQYTKTEFKQLGSNPLIKDILSGMTKLNKEDIKNRIAEHLALVK